jgi:DegV family protein with EDD domain
MFKIVLDSGCDVVKDIVEYPMERVPLHLHFDDRVFVDDEDIDVDEFLDHMDASPLAVKSAAPSPASFLEKYLGDESVFVITLSSKLSGSYQSAMLAKKMYFEEYGEKFIHVFDSLSATIGCGMIAHKVSEFAKKGLSNMEIIEHVNHFIKNMGTYFLLDKFDNLVKTGRINPYIAKFTSLLNIKLICGADGSGNIKMMDKTRGYNRAVKRLIEIIKENTPDIESRIVGISHCKCYEKAVAFKDEFLKVLRVKDVFITECTGTIATYANRGGFIVSL